MDPLLERDEQLAVLVAAVDAAREGRGELVLVAGEAGMGKTSLLRALRSRLDDGALPSGSCEPLSVPVPLAPLRGSPREPPGGPLALAFACPPPPRAPAVAVLEDAHWADPADARRVRLLARRVEDAGSSSSSPTATTSSGEPALGLWSAISPAPVAADALSRCRTPPGRLAGPTEVDADGLWR